MVTAVPLSCRATPQQPVITTAESEQSSCSMIPTVKRSKPLRKKTGKDLKNKMEKIPAKRIIKKCPKKRRENVTRFLENVCLGVFQTNADELTVYAHGAHSNNTTGYNVSDVTMTSCPCKHLTLTTLRAGDLERSH